jgi:hypothetical protein
MDRELTHADIEALLGAFALDAVDRDSDEYRAVEQHLAGCPRCRAEVADHREVAATLALTGREAPDGIWDRIAGELNDGPDAPAVLPFLRPARTGVSWRTFTVTAAAAALLIGFLTTRVIDDGRRVDHLAAAVRTHTLQSAALAALSDPTATRVDLHGDGGRRAELVVLGDGTGWLLADRLPSLDAGHTYQLWGVRGPDKISLGVLGATVTVAAFHTTRDITTFAITEERAGGVVTTTRSPVVAGRSD